MKSSDLGVVAGRYRLLDVIGRGGMGTVYEAEHVQSGQRLALKMLSLDVPDHELTERFRREAKAATVLDHPNIVEIFDLVTENNALYLVMELLRGQSIRELLDAGPLYHPSIKRDALATGITSTGMDGIELLRSERSRSRFAG